jgi:hypothetical protein
MERDIHQQIRQNLFDAARQAVGNWERFPWHKDRNGNIQTLKPGSSQALAIDVFGTLKTSPCRDLIIGKIAERFGLSSCGPWDVLLEWCSPDNELREKRQTQVDVAVVSPSTLIFFECKFTEAGGACSQTLPLKSGPNRGIIQCSGNYQLQINPLNVTPSKYSLTQKGITYWDVVPRILRYSDQTQYSPCPFAGSNFQWMRNLALCFERARVTARHPAVIVTYADHPKLQMTQELASFEWRAFRESVRDGPITLSAMSYQDMIGVPEAAVADQPDEANKWRTLRRWIERKITRAGGVEDEVQPRSRR